MTTKNEQSCFGNNGSRASCRNCRYRASCRYYTTHPLNDTPDNRGKVDFESVSGWLEEIADHSNIPGCTAETQPDMIGVDKLAAFFRYLLNLDRYTLSLLKHLMSDNNAENGIPSISEIARARGCSRQAVHRKILEIIRKYPELSSLFLLTLRHLPRSCKSHAGA